MSKNLIKPKEPNGSPDGVLYEPSFKNCPTCNHGKVTSTCCAHSDCICGGIPLVETCPTCHGEGMLEISEEEENFYHEARMEEQDEH